MKKRLLLLSMGLCLVLMSACGANNTDVPQAVNADISTTVDSSEVGKTQNITDEAEIPELPENPEASTNDSDISITKFDGPVEKHYDEDGLAYCDKIEDCINYFLSFDSSSVSEDITSFEIRYIIDDTEIYSRRYEGEIKKDEFYFCGIDKEFVDGYSQIELEFIVNDDEALTWRRGVSVEFNNISYATAYDIEPNEDGCRMESVVSG